MARALKVALALTVALAGAAGAAGAGRAAASELVALGAPRTVVTSPLPHEYLAGTALPEEWDWCDVGGRSLCTRSLNQQ
jgi:hypothetical protein